MCIRDSTVTRDERWIAGPPPHATGNSDSADTSTVNKDRDSFTTGDAADLVGNAENTIENSVAATPRGGGLSVFKLLTEIFLADEPPVFILVAAGGWLVVAERDNWPLGKYLAINLAAVAERADTTQAGETAHTVCLTCLLYTSDAADE